MLKKRKQDRFFSQKAFLILILLLSELIFVFSDYFSLKEIEIVGNNKIEQQEILEFAGLAPGLNLFLLNLPELKQRISKHPWVRDVQVSSRLPETLKMAIREREVKLAGTNDEKEWYALDEEGVILDKFKAPPPENLPKLTLEFPLKTGTKIPPEAASLVNWIITKLPFNEREKIKYFKLNNEGLNLGYTEKGIKVKLGKFEKLEEKLEILQALLTQLEEQKKLEQLDYVDFSHKKLVVKFR